MTSQQQDRVLILGAAGRDFHDFNVYWKARSDVRVVCFTATQIPDIHGRVYPAELAGPNYPQGIPIYDQDRLETIIREERIARVALSYSDLHHEQVMHLACRAHSAGAEFVLLAPQQTMLTSRKPVIAVCAVRTGCGKSQTARRISQILRDMGRKIAVIRHPMPYGDLTRQTCQRFGRINDLDAHHCTIEEREEYEPHIEMGNVVFAGIDYAEILRMAETEADVILWDGGNNDVPFLSPDLHIVLVDPHRPGHELRYFPGETNLRMADIVVINKVDTADAEDLAVVRDNVERVNPRAVILEADSPVTVSDAQAIIGRRVLVIEDGPTLTHGDMAYGAGRIAAREFGALEVIDPRPHAVGSIRRVFEAHRQLHDVLPAMGYGAAQIAELQATINAVPCEAVLIGTPIDLRRVLKIDKPAIRVRYELREHDTGILPSAIGQVVGR